MTLPPSWNKYQFEPPPSFKSRALMKIINALTDEHNATLIVGGAVRDWQKGDPIKDIDLATSLTPQEVIKRLKACNIKTIPTGIKHGTVTALSHHENFEITTLRRDVTTDGRHAQVAFGKNWDEDWKRRDFTFNALYAHPDGSLYDPSGQGLKDLKDGTVRFIGEAEQRIREDYLRLIRFFRFYSLCGKGVDDKTLATLQKEKEGLDKISGERLWRELCLLLTHPAPLKAFEFMATLGILAKLSFTSPHINKNLHRLFALEKSSVMPALLPCRLATLIHEEKGIETFVNRFKPPKTMRIKLKLLLDEQMQNECVKNTPHCLRLFVHKHGNEQAQEFMLTCHALDIISQKRALKFIQRLNNYHLAPFPLKGRDLHS